MQVRVCPSLQARGAVFQQDWFPKRSRCLRVRTLCLTAVNRTGVPQTHSSSEGSNTKHTLQISIPRSSTGHLRLSSYPPHDRCPDLDVLLPTSGNFHWRGITPMFNGSLLLSLLVTLALHPSQGSASPCSTLHSSCGLADLKASAGAGPNVLARVQLPIHGGGDENTIVTKVRYERFVLAQDPPSIARVE